MALPVKKTVALIDGGHLRAMAGSFKIAHEPDFIEEFCNSLAINGEENLNKVLYYDCRPYNGTQKAPVSGTDIIFNRSASWLDELACRDKFATRLGQLKWRGWIPKKIPVAGATLSDSDFGPSFEQKGVDMRLGLDISNIAVRLIYDRILLVTADHDMIPAMKEARRVGIQVVLYQLPFLPSRAHRDKLKLELKSHSDFVRDAVWPARFFTAAISAASVAPASASSTPKP